MMMRTMTTLATWMTTRKMIERHTLPFDSPCFFSTWSLIFQVGAAQHPNIFLKEFKRPHESNWFQRELPSSFRRVAIVGIAPVSCTD